VINLVHVVGLDGRGQFRGFGDIPSNEDDLIQEVGNSLGVGITLKQDEVLAGDSLLAHQVTRKIRT